MIFKRVKLFIFSLIFAPGIALCENWPPLGLESPNLCQFYFKTVSTSVSPFRVQFAKGEDQADSIQTLARTYAHTLVRDLRGLQFEVNHLNPTLTKLERERAVLRYIDAASEQIEHRVRLELGETLLNQTFFARAKRSLTFSKTKGPRDIVGVPLLTSLVAGLFVGATYDMTAGAAIPTGALAIQLVLMKYQGSVLKKVDDRVHSLDLLFRTAFFKALELEVVRWIHEDYVQTTGLTPEQAEPIFNQIIGLATTSRLLRAGLSPQKFSSNWHN